MQPFRLVILALAGLWLGIACLAISAALIVAHFQHPRDCPRPAADPAAGRMKGQ